MNSDLLEEWIVFSTLQTLWGILLVLCGNVS